MRKIALIMSAALLGFGNVASADNQTQDSTNTYSPANQDVEKAHQKPDAMDESTAGSTGTDSNTSKSKSRMHKKHKSQKATGTNTEDSTNTYSPANQDKEKLHQKPKAEDESSN